MPEEGIVLAISAGVVEAEGLIADDGGLDLLKEKAPAREGDCVDWLG